MREEKGSGARKKKGAPRARRAAAPKRTLEEALRRLEEIAAILEKGTPDLEAALELYREARELHAFCVEQLSAAEREARVLTEDGGLEDADLAPEP